jgi:hypothetical protein
MTPDPIERCLHPACSALETHCQAISELLPSGWSIVIRVFCDRPVASAMSPYGKEIRLAGGSLREQIENAFEAEIPRKPNDQAHGTAGGGNQPKAH